MTAVSAKQASEATLSAKTPGGFFDWIRNLTSRGYAHHLNATSHVNPCEFHMLDERLLQDIGIERKARPTTGLYFGLRVRPVSIAEYDYHLADGVNDVFSRDLSPSIRRNRAARNRV